MARQLVCDICHAVERDLPIHTVRWTFIGLAKLDSPAVFFERKEICPDCTTKVRRLLQDQQAPQ